MVDPTRPVARNPSEALHGSHLGPALVMTPQHSAPFAALAAIGLGVEAEPGVETSLPADEVRALREASALLAFAAPPLQPTRAGRARLLRSLPAAPLARRRRSRRPGRATRAHAVFVRFSDR